MVGAGEQYADDPEGANMMAYDMGWFCGKYLGCVAFDKDDEEPSPSFDNPQWVIALWRDGKERDEFLALAVTIEDWPTDVLATIAEQLGFGLVIRDNTFNIGGYYMSREGDSSIALVCYDAVTGDGPFFRGLRSPVSIIPTADIDWKEWGVK